jgi:copper transport protein
MGRAAWFALAVVGAALGAVLVAAPSAGAHAVLTASQPQARDVLNEGPAAVTLTFTEPPELAFSAVQVLDRGGRAYGAGSVEAVPGDPQTLRVGLRPLDRGVYTVNWRVVSRVDGHLTAGSFAFGVGEAVTEEVAVEGVAGPTNRLVMAVGGRWLFYAGLALLVGGAWVGAAAFGDRRPSLVRLWAGAWVAAGAGVAAVGVAQRQLAGVGWGEFLRAPLGRSVLWRAAALGVAGAGILIARRAHRRGWRAGAVAVGVGAAAAAAVHVDAGHAAAASWPGVMVGVQGLHFLAAGAWLGGLAALLVGVGRRPGAAEAAAARRYGTGAAIALAVVVVSGVVRAAEAVGGWGLLVDTEYGRLVLAKSVLVVVLGALGAVNHYRNVPAAGSTVRGLRRVGAAELAVAAGVFGITGLLTTAAPPAGLREAEPSVVVAEGADFGTTVRAHLSATPGMAGDNRFTVRLEDYDSGEPLAADRVSIRFALPANPGIPPSTLELVPGGTGTFVASGSNLVVAGRWRATVVVERAPARWRCPSNWSRGCRTRR